MHIQPQCSRVIPFCAFIAGALAFGPSSHAQINNASLGTLEFLNNDATRDSGNDQQPSIATDQKGNWVAVWQTVQEGGTNNNDRVEVRWANSADGGRTWSAPATLLTDGRTSGADDESPVIVTDGKGNWVVAWISPLSGSADHGGTASDVLVARSTNNGQTWGQPVRIATPPQDIAEGAVQPTDHDVALATDGDVWILLWSSTRDIAGGGGSHAVNDTVILMAQSIDRGASWISAGSFTPFDGTGDITPTIAANGDGQWIASWSSGGKIVFAESIDDGLTFSEPIDMSNGSGAANPVVAYSRSQSADDSDGQWMVAFAQAGEVFVSRSSNSDSSTAVGTERNWSTPSRVAVGVNPSIASGLEDSWVVAWEQTGLLGEDIDILAAQSRDGGMSWDEPEPLNADANEDSNEDLGVQLASDGAGSWLAVWYSGNQSKSAGDDEDVFVLPFALASDCDGDGIGDAQQSRFVGDCDGDGVPDDCDDSVCSAGGSGSGGSGGSGGSVGCGAGAVGMIPLMMLGLGSLGAVSRRRTR
ncbi:MAG: exo-alpha-sialidase [Phycisphaerales bacterium]|nr:exo-alpha-sialidase [Phycisphaerales bacterium]